MFYFYHFVFPLVLFIFSKFVDAEPSECVVRAELLPNRIIRLVNGEELCRCLGYNYSYNESTTRTRIESCNIKTFNEEGKLGFSAANVCGCVGFQTSILEETLNIMPPNSESAITTPKTPHTIKESTSGDISINNDEFNKANASKIMEQTKEIIFMNTNYSAITQSNEYFNDSVVEMLNWLNEQNSTEYYNTTFTNENETYGTNTIFKNGNDSVNSVVSKFTSADGSNLLRSTIRISDTTDKSNDEKLNTIDDDFTTSNASKIMDQHKEITLKNITYNGDNVATESNKYIYESSLQMEDQLNNTDYNELNAMPNHGNSYRNENASHGPNILFNYGDDLIVPLIPKLTSNDSSPGEKDSTFRDSNLRGNGNLTNGTTNFLHYSDDLIVPLVFGTSADDKRNSRTSNFSEHLLSLDKKNEKGVEVKRMADTNNLDSNASHKQDFDSNVLYNDDDYDAKDTWQDLINSNVDYSDLFPPTSLHDNGTDDLFPTNTPKMTTDQPQEDIIINNLDKIDASPSSWAQDSQNLAAVLLLITIGTFLIIILPVGIFLYFECLKKGSYSLNSSPESYSRMEMGTIYHRR